MTPEHSSQCSRNPTLRRRRSTMRHPARSACVIITECQTMNPKSPKASSRRSPARAGKSAQQWNSRSATKMQVSRSVEATEERTLKIASGTHGWFTFLASVRRFGLELDRQPAAYLWLFAPRHFPSRFFRLIRPLPFEVAPVLIFHCDPAPTLRSFYVQAFRTFAACGPFSCWCRTSECSNSSW